MPVIQRFQTRESIDERVQSASINQTGEAPVAAAIANIGAQGAQFANEFLLKMKQAQARKYASDSTREKRIGAERVRTEMFNDMDPGTGQMPDGRTFYDNYREWEENQTTDFEENAPTDLAKESFLTADRPSTTERLLGVDALQHKTIIAQHLTDQVKGVEETQKRVLSHDPEQPGAISHTQFTTKELQEMEKDISKDIGTFANEIEVESRITSYGNGIANQGVDAMFISEDDVQVSQAIGMGRMIDGNPQLQKEVRGLLIENGVISEKDGLVHTKFGLAVMLEEPSKDPEAMGKAMVIGTGEIIDAKAKDKQLISADVINVPVERENKILKYLTPDDQKRHAFRLLKLLKTKKSKRKGETRLAVDNFAARLESSDTGNKVRVRKGTPEQEFYADMFNRIDQDFIDDPAGAQQQKEKLITARAIGDFSDANNLVSPATAQRQLNNLPNKVKQEAEAAGMRLDKSGMGQLVQRAVNAVKINMQQETVQKLKNTSDYLRKVDPTYRKLDDNMFRNESTFQDRNGHLKSQGLQMGVPEYLIDKNMFSDSLLDSEAFEINEALTKGPDDAYNSVDQYVTARKNVMGDKFLPYIKRMSDKKRIPDFMEWTTLYSNNLDGKAKMRQSLADMHFMKEREKVLGKKIQEDIRKEVFNRTAKLNAGIMQGTFKGDPAQKILTINEVAYANAIGLYLNNHSQNSSAVGAADRAVKNILDPLMSTFTSGDSTMTVHNYVLEEYDLHGKPEVVERAMSTYARPDTLVKYVDVEATIGTRLTEMLNEEGVVGREARNKRGFEMLNQLSGLEGKWIVSPDEDGHLYPGYHFDSAARPLVARPLSDPTNRFRVPMKELEKDKEVQEFTPVDQFIQEIFKFDPKVLKK